ncbi:MAG: hypothetical protein K2F93_04725 [Muribaculaceae bacterium]|nr:hypothetical protein [Muribaculaceae bacterium]
MKKTARIYLACMAIVGGLHASAQNPAQLMVVANDAEGVAMAEAPVGLESKLRFVGDGVEVYSGETLEAVFHYADLKALSFRFDAGTAVGQLSSEAALRLRANPVDESLEFVGFSGAAVPLSICGLKGETLVNVASWSGEGVDVSALAPGLYIARVGESATFKFIKR